MTRLCRQGRQLPTLNAAGRIKTRPAGHACTHVQVSSNTRPVLGPHARQQNATFTPLNHRPQGGGERLLPPLEAAPQTSSHGRHSVTHTHPHTPAGSLTVGRDGGVARDAALVCRSQVGASAVHQSPPNRGWREQYRRPGCHTTQVFPVVPAQGAPAAEWSQGAPAAEWSQNLPAILGSQGRSRAPNAANTPRAPNAPGNPRTGPTTPSSPLP